MPGPSTVAISITEFHCMYAMAVLVRKYMLVTVCYGFRLVKCGDPLGTALDKAFDPVITREFLFGPNMV